MQLAGWHPWSRYGDDEKGNPQWPDNVGAGLPRARVRSRFRHRSGRANSENARRPRGRIYLRRKKEQAHA